MVGGMQGVGGCAKGWGSVEDVFPLELQDAIGAYAQLVD